jgi:hypothetical protein
MGGAETAYAKRPGAVRTVGVELAASGQEALLGLAAVAKRGGLLPEGRAQPALSADAAEPDRNQSLRARERLRKVDP